MAQEDVKGIWSKAAAVSSTSSIESDIKPLQTPSQCLEKGEGLIHGSGGIKTKRNVSKS